MIAENGCFGREEMDMVLVAATLAYNQLASCHGASPIQHIMGQHVRLLAACLGTHEEVSVHSHMLEKG